LAYLEEFVVEIEVNNLVLLKHKTKQHYFIQLVPAIEKWILNAADEIELNIEKIGLPRDLKQLKKITKNDAASENELLKDLCTRLIMGNGRTITILSSWLNYLYEHNRNADINVLKGNV